MTGSLPVSDALCEASSESLSELFSRDPEGYQQQDLDRIIEELRRMRLKWEAAEASGTTRRERTKQAASTTSSMSADDLGL